VNKSLVAILAAGMLSVSPLVISGALAMGNELTMLEDAINRDFAKLGIAKFEMGDLTLSQLAEIKRVLDSNDYSSSERKQQIEVILTRGQ